ncbi:MAG: ATP-binding cassette domain-containing protein, partial [Acetobacter papayae]
MSQFLEISGLNARIDADGQEKQILRGVDLSIPPGEVHVIMGPNGSGKSTLSYVLAGRDDYEVTSGSVQFQGQDLLAMEPEERAAAGLFLAFQSPVELPGVNNANFLRTAVNAVRRARGQEELDAVAFLKLAREAAK